MNLRSQCQCLFMFFYVFLSFFTIKIWVGARILTGIWHSQVRYSQDGPVMPGSLRVPKTSEAQRPSRHPWDSRWDSWNPSVQGPKWRRRPPFFGKKPKNTPDWVLKTIWTEFGLIDLYKILSNTYFETPMLPPKKYIISSQGVTLSF